MEPIEEAHAAFRQDLSLMRAGKTGGRGFDEAGFAAALGEVGAALADVRARRAEGALPLLDVPDARDDLPACREAAGMLREGARHVVVFGTGGSSLGAHALIRAGALFPSRGTDGAEGPEVLFFDNLETPWMEEALSRLDPEETRFLVISKSGSTPETLLQTAFALERLKAAGLAPSRHMVVLTQPAPETRNPLRAIAAAEGLTVVDHPPGVGGRFSVLTSVGVLPAMVAGLDPVRLREGARDVLRPLLSGAPAAEIAPAAGAAAFLALARKGGLSAVVTMPYSSRLRLFAAWFAQLWAESLGKDGRGTQPVTAVGPVDQHSQLQLFLDGPNDRAFTILMPDTRGKGFRAPRAWKDRPGFGYLAGRTIGDMTACQQRATAETLAGRGRPVRVIRLNRLDEAALGALFMHFMLETILVGRAMGVDPFDQPAVELSKALTRDCMNGIAPE